MQLQLAAATVKMDRTIYCNQSTDFINLVSHRQVRSHLDLAHLKTHNMKLLFSSFVASIAADFVTVDFNLAGLQIVDAALNNTVLANSLLSHGCWCAKLDPSQDVGILGGPTPIDDLDDLCKKWFMCRHCNDHLFGGSCSNSTIYPDLSAEAYEVIDLINPDIATCESTNSQTGDAINNCAGS